jgi:hypothetical protein
MERHVPLKARASACPKFLKGSEEMRKPLSLLAFGSVCGMLAFGADFSGKLIDASCYSQQQKASACSATSATTTFALDVSGKVYNLDAAGNSKAATAMKSRADRAVDPANPQANQIMAKVSGTESGGTIAVDSVDVQ